MTTHTGKRRGVGNHYRQTGVTFIELMIVVVIIGIIAAVAYPSYTQSIVRAKRNAGKSMLLQVADRQEQFFMDNKAYAANLTALGFPGNPFMINDEGMLVADAAADRVYQITLSNTAATTFTANAIPQLMMATRDTDCGNLTLTHTGIKGQGGTGDRCW